MERKPWVFEAFFLLMVASISMELAAAQGNGNESSSASMNAPPFDAASQQYRLVSPKSSGEERALCVGRGKCLFKVLSCPAQCSQRKPTDNKKRRGCFIDCGGKCEATCKWRLPNCSGYGSLCYDPRFVGGDGTMFYFHGAKDGNFAIVSDDSFQINAHFIGTRPQGRSRDFTWVQAFAVMLNAHTLVLAADKVSSWNDRVDNLIIKWDSEAVQIPTGSDAEWRVSAGEKEVVIERTDGTNGVKVTVEGLVEINVKVRPIGEIESKVHKYELAAGDAFAHLETRFKFWKVTEQVEGVLGKTYRPGYVSPVKRGVPMPMMGGEDKYETPSLLSPLCKVCRFRRQSAVADI